VFGWLVLSASVMIEWVIKNVYPCIFKLFCAQKPFPHIFIYFELRTFTIALSEPGLG